ncbi:MAG: CRISPR-associated endonuclease Cas6 [Bacteroidota bacterium]
MKPNKSPIIPTIHVEFDLPLRPRDLRAWRGAVAESAGWETSDHFHNHAPSEVIPGEEDEGLNKIDNGIIVSRPKRVTLRDRYVYRYPLIQYRIVDGRASIFGIGDGVVTLKKWLFALPEKISVRGREYDLVIHTLRERRQELKMSHQMMRYRLMDYIGLNQENYRRWAQETVYTERVKLLEKCLTGHLLGFASAWEYRLPERLEVSIQLIKRTKHVRAYKTEHLAFNLIYQTNLELPEWIGLGRGIARGYGVQNYTSSQRGGR